MSQQQMLEQLRLGNVQAVIAALEAAEAEYEEYCSQAEAEFWAGTRERCSSPAQLEEVPF